MTVVSSYEAQFKATGVEETKNGFEGIAKAAALMDRQARVNTQNLKDYAKSQIQTEKEKARAMEMSAKEQAKASAQSDAMWKKVGAGAAVAAAAVVKFGLDSYKAYQQYAGAVRDVALASGASAEQSSIFLQVLDDFEISAEDVTKAMKAMTKNGMTPTIDTLAQLADQYVAIEDPMKRNEFLMKNLGKAGLQWANALSQGGDALRASSADINENLILTDEQIKKAEMARLAVDAWADAWEGFKISIGGAIGELIAANATISSQSKEYEKLTGTTLNFSRSQGEATKNFEAFQAQMARGVATTEFYKAQMGDVSTSTDELAAQQKDLEESSKQYMSVLKNISGETEQFTQKNAELNEKLTELEEKLAKERKGSDAYKEIQGEIEDTKTAVTELADEHAKASKSMMFDLISQQAAAEGFKNISVQALATLGEQWGILAEGSGEATSTMISQAEAWTQALEQPGGKLQSIIEMWDNLRELSKKGITLTATVVQQATGGAMGGQNTMTQCFTGDTLVSMADGSSVAIKDIFVGDVVLSHDTNSGQNIKTVVVETFQHPASDGGRLLLINGYLKVTPEHLLWNGHTWQPAGEFAPGDVLINLDGSHMRVVSVREIVKNEPVYNIHVDNEVHNYYAGGVLVHNAKQNDVVTQWAGGTVGSFAGGGKAGGWGMVGDRPNGGFIPGVSELIFGNAHVFNSQQSAKMLKSGMFGNVPGFALGGQLKRGSKKPQGSSTSTGSGGSGGSLSTIPEQASTPVEMGMVLDSIATETATEVQHVASQVEVAITNMTAQIEASNNKTQSILERVVSVLLSENPRAVGKQVAFEVSRMS